jgi:hypothetical protein
MKDPLRALALVLAAAALIAILAAGISGVIGWKLLWTVGGNGVLFFFAALIIGIFVSQFFRPGSSLARRLLGFVLALVIAIPVLSTAYLFTAAPAVILVENDYIPPLQIGVLIITSVVGFAAGASRETGELESE